MNMSYFFLMLCCTEILESSDSVEILHRKKACQIHFKNTWDEFRFQCYFQKGIASFNICTSYLKLHH